ncbi:MAG: gfo/Idh/MocA family oxidoreductase, partial [Planctomycetaceae bacterium]|nr:gfo/Idh/MocA family oxidoreductase [Planctomycetaceae bacterium]
QIHSHKFYRTAVHAIQKGAIGKVKQVHSWCAATGHGKSGFMDRPKNPVEPPKTVDWNLWIGVAPMRPYGVDRCYHPWGWRDWQDFGNGALGDFGCHILDPVFTALNIQGAPKTFKTTHSGMNDEVWPAQTQVDYVFGGTEHTTGKDLAITWYDGGLLPSVRGSHVPGDQALPRSGSLFIGETGSLILPHVGALKLFPSESSADAQIEEAEDLNHYHGWVDGCLSGKQPSDGFEYGGRLTEAVLLGNIGARFQGQTLAWDDQAMKITNVPEANQWIKREARTGWEIPPAG